MGAGFGKNGRDGRCRSDRDESDGGSPLTCAYCEKILICDACQADVIPPAPEQHRALSWPEARVACPSCGALLVCKWCKTPYDGAAGEGEAPDD
jgi:hypothetical protein